MSRKDRIRYYLAAAQFWREAIEVQTERCLTGSNDLRLARLDLSFYIVAVQRLRHVAVRAGGAVREKRISRLSDDFGSKWPECRELRNLEEHIKGPKGKSPSGIWYFKGLVAECRPDGSSESLVDIDAMRSDVDALSQGIDNLLREQLVRLGEESHEEVEGRKG